jgi:hypothetical protein
MWKFLRNNDFLLFAIPLVAVVAYLFITHQPFFAIALIIAGAGLGAMEIVSVVITGKTISEHFADERNTNFKPFIWTIILLVIFFAALILHFCVTGG